MPTDDGTAWLKIPSESTGSEVGLYALLETVAPERIPVTFGADVERRWLLLADGGPSLRSRFPGAASLPILEGALPVYGELQRRLAPHADRLLALGLADMRPAAMPARLDEALAAVGDAREVEAARGRYADWCAELGAAPGEAALDHNDLHGDNILVGADGSVRFYDWGDAVVAHPFASMLMGLGEPTLVLGCDERDTRIIRLRDAYLEAFSDLAPHAELVRTLELACRVAKAARALTWHRAVGADPDAPPEFAAAPRESLVAVLDPAYLTGF